MTNQMTAFKKIKSQATLAWLPYFTLAFLLSIIPSQAQNVTIKVTNTLAENGTEVWFCRSIDRDPANYVLFYDSAVFENGTLSKSFYIDSTMFIMLANNPYIPKIRLVIEKGDSIHIDVRQDPVKHITVVSFEGRNKAGLDNYFSSSLFVGGKTNNEVFNKLTSSKNVEDAIQGLEELKDSLFRPMDSLLALGKISGEYYKFVKSEGESEFLAAVLSISSTAEFRYESDKHKFQLSRNDFRSIQKIFCEKYDPFSTRYRNVNYRSTNARSKCRLISDGIISYQGTYNNLKIWLPKDSVYNFAPVEIQERMFATDLIANLKFGVINVSDASRDNERLAKALPNSIFLPVIKKIIESSRDQTKIRPYSFTKYDKANNSFGHFELDSLVTLQALVKRHFPGKAVMVDLWATWCSPCKAEFAFSNDLHAFLKQNKIEILYFSVDSESNGLRWKKDIQLFKLDGFHYLGTNKAFGTLGKLLNEGTIGIPRYLLFDTRGELIDANLPRPSEGKILHDKILSKKM